MKRRYVVLGADYHTVSKAAKRMNERLNLKSYDGNQLIKKSPSKEASMMALESVLEDENCLIHTTYNRILSVGTNQFETFVFLDFSLLYLIFRCLCRFDLRGMKQVIHFNRVKRPWILNKLNQFGVEKTVVILSSPKQVRKYMKQIG